MSVKKALIVIDMQNDYLWAKRKSKFLYNTETLVANVNETVKRFRDDGADVIYIGQVFPDLPTNRLIIGFSIKGTEGAELYGGLDVASDLYFEKNLPDSFTAKRFKKFMSEKSYNEITVCGVDLCGCVGATALGALKTGAKIYLDEKSTGCRFSQEKAEKRKKQLMNKGVIFV